MRDIALRMLATLCTLALVAGCAGTGQAPAASGHSAANPVPPTASSPPEATAAPGGAETKAGAPGVPAAKASAPARPGGASAAGAGARPAGGTAAGPAASGPKPFADVIKDAVEIPGLVTLWQKEEKVWIELAPDQLERPMMLAINLARGIGEHRLHAGAMGSTFSVGDQYVVEFRKIGGIVQMIARNTTFTARPGSPEERAVKKGFSDSLLASAPVASAPHPDRKSVLIEANALLLADIPKGTYAIERAYRNNFGFDAKNSFITGVKSGPDQTTIDVTAHYQQSRVPVPPAQTGPTPAPYYPPPEVIEDPRSLFLGYLYSFTRLPEQPMRPRLADPRIGHFYTKRVDFSSERRVSANQFIVQRWRLEPKDPSAALSEPVKPIVFWLDREIPERYRAPIAAGILEWNKAFEKIGIRDAIQAKIQPDDADWDNADTLHASVRWMTTARPSYGAIGPSHVDPRTGEILDADIGIDANSTRSIRAYRTEVLGDAHAPMYDEHTGEILPQALGIVPGDDRACGYAAQAAREHGFALALLEARGEIDPDGPEAERFVADFLKDVTMHEVGHTLGLMHNFRASTIYTAAQLADPEFTARHGIGGSVMEYNPFNLARTGEKQGAYGMGTLGPYDYWAIEYAYRPLAPENEGAELARIAARSSEPQLAFANDVDALEGADPDVNQFDLGDDALAYYRKRIALSLELWDRLERRELRPGESYDVLRRRFVTGFSNISLATGLAAKYVGGLTLVRDHAGSGRAPMTPVPVARQREALAMLTEGLFKVESFRVPPELLRQLSPDRLERGWNVRSPTDLQLPEMILAAQRDVLNRLMSPAVANRLLANETKVTNVSDALSLSELYDTLQRAIWEEAAAGADAPALRRNLQREHLRRLTAALLGSTAGLPADARALQRLNAQRLRDTLGKAMRSPAISPETRAHYAEAHDTLSDALRAPLIRSGV
jgi:hypothetical protein